MYQKVQHGEVIAKVRHRKQVSESRLRPYMCSVCSFSIYLSQTFVSIVLYNGFTAIVVNQ